MSGLRCHLRAKAARLSSSVATNFISMRDMIIIALPGRGRRKFSGRFRFSSLRAAHSIDATQSRVSKVDLVDINTDKSFRTKKIDMTPIRLEGDAVGGSDEDEDEDEESTPVPRAEVSLVEIC